MENLTTKQRQNLLEFWQTAQIDNSLYNSYCRIDVSAINNDKILNAIKSTLTYDCGDYLALEKDSMETLLTRIREIR